MVGERADQAIDLDKNALQGSMKTPCPKCGTEAAIKYIGKPIYCCWKCKNEWQA
jgi:ribosomal protein L37AE/L43A